MNFLNEVQLLATDILNSVNHQIFERRLRFRDNPGSTPLSVSTTPIIRRVLGTYFLVFLPPFVHMYERGGVDQGRECFRVRARWSGE
eukprot:g16106.t1